MHFQAVKSRLADYFTNFFNVFIEVPEHLQGELISFGICEAIVHSDLVEDAGHSQPQRKTNRETESPLLCDPSASTANFAADAQTACVASVASKATA